MVVVSRCAPRSGRLFFGCFRRQSRHNVKNGPRMLLISATHYQLNRVARRHTQTDD
jgi:hypothetical protein